MPYAHASCQPNALLRLVYSLNRFRSCSLRRTRCVDFDSNPFLCSMSSQPNPSAFVSNIGQPARTLAARLFDISKSRSIYFHLKIIHKPKDKPNQTKYAYSIRQTPHTAYTLDIHFISFYRKTND